MKKIVTLILWIIAFQLIGYGMGLLTQANIDTWYPTLQKSILTPPPIIFPIVWSCLYVMLAIAGWSLSENINRPNGRLIFGLYAVEMLMNWAWTPLFFHFHLIQLGFYWIILMTILTIIIIILAKKQFKLAYFLLIPYCLWLFFAGYLNWAIWMKN